MTSAPTPEQSAALAALRELLLTHYAEAEDSADDNGRFAISFSVKFDRSHEPTLLKVTSRISKSISDEIELRVDESAGVR